MPRTKKIILKFRDFSLSSQAQNYRKNQLAFAQNVYQVPSGQKHKNKSCTAMQEIHCFMKQFLMLFYPFLCSFDPTASQRGYDPNEKGAEDARGLPSLHGDDQLHAGKNGIRQGSQG